MLTVLPEALVGPIFVCVGVAALCFVLSVVFDEYSFVDRIWSVVPVVYLALFARAADFADARLNVMTGLTALWGARLTFNYARKGGYQKGGEDYRWKILKARMKPWQWLLFNLLFIASYQNVLLLLITLPGYTALTHRSPLGVVDVALAVAFLVCLVGEFVADQQQWAYQQNKKAQQAAGQSTGDGFVSTGLWAYSRHPNFFFEQAQWVIVYGFGAVAAGTALVPTGLGAVLLILLFWGSTRFTESITASKYPAYVAYQARVSAVVPWPPRAR